MTGERIRYFRKLSGLTQKELGVSVGFSLKNADVRIAQYEKEARFPKEELTEKLAATLNVSPAALKVPDIDSAGGVINTLFALEDMYGLEIGTADDGIVLRIRERPDDPDNAELRDALTIWLSKAMMMRSGDISIEEYDNWRYNYGA